MAKAIKKNNNQTDSKDQQDQSVKRQSEQTQEAPSGVDSGEEASKSRQSDNKDKAGQTGTQQQRNPQRQSSPKPTARDELVKMYSDQMLQQMKQGNFDPNMHGGMMPDGASPQPQMGQQSMMPGAVNGFTALSNPIGKEQIHKAVTILNKYKQGKANLEHKIIDDEQWYKLRHWECMRKKQSNQVQPTSGWLFNCIANKHADAMDNFPSPNVLPREEGDKAEAEMLSAIIPVVLDMCDFEKTYSEVTTYKLKTGTGVYGIYWDSTKLNGLGDISIKKVDLLTLFWDNTVSDIQDSKHMFSVELVDNESLLEMYPQLEGKLGSKTISVAEYIHDESIDTSDMSCVVDWYYHKTNSQGRKVLHYCKFVNDEVLFATENDPQMAERGLYDHARYPFEFDALFPVEGMPTGFGYVDVGKSTQEYIDRLNQCIMQNSIVNARPRYFIRSDGAVNESEFADMTKDFVHVDGNLGSDSIVPIQGNTLDDIYVTIINNKIDELKETTGNRDVSSGGSTSGVTAASAIAAMQESGSKLSRTSSKQSYRVFRQICYDVIELIRQFYDMPRSFRIMGQSGAMRFVQYSNAGLVPQMQGMDWGIDMGVRVPQFDIEVSAQKQSPYSKMSQNELALQLYSAGLFNPQVADQALICLDMMDFERKEPIMQKIQQNGGMMQQMMALAQMVDQAHGTTEVQEGIASQFGMPMMSSGASGASGKKASGGESSVTTNARETAANATAPR